MVTMKIISWNCNGAFRKKFHTLDDFHADISIVQECENPAESTQKYRNWASNYLWTGENRNKGIGIFAQPEICLSRLDWNDEGLQSFLPCRVNNAFNLIAVWTKYANSPNFRYIGQLWKYLNLHGEKLRDQRSILTGDFNSNACWDEWDRWWNHSDVVQMLDLLGLSSLYHTYFGEAQGQESRPTLFHQRNKDKPYHVDYAFASAELFDPAHNQIEVGDKSFWLEHSDHMPIVFSIDS
jgi:exonuclease III